MKKLSVIILFAIAAFLFIGCGDDEGTGLRWDNQSGQSVADINWQSTDGVNIYETWNAKSYADLEKTEYKEIKKLRGQGECLFETDGATAVIQVDTSNSSGIEPISSSTSIEVTNNADATLVISNSKKK